MNLPPERKDFATRVKVLRSKLGLTQDDLAVTLGVRRQTVALWEVGGSAPQAAPMGRFEALERTMMSNPNGATVDAVYEEGASHVRTWLLDYTGRVLHAQADAFMQAKAGTPYVDHSIVPEARATPPAPAVRKKGTDRG